MERLPEFELLSHGAIRAVHEALYGTRDIPLVDISRADLLLTLGADIVATHVSPVRYAREVTDALEHGLEWFHLEPGLTLTGANATHRMQIRVGSEAWLLAHLLRACSPPHPLPQEIRNLIPMVEIGDVARRTGLSEEEIAQIAVALQHADRPLIVAGGQATAHEGGLMVALLAALLQESFRMIGGPVDLAGRENWSSVGTPGELEEIAGRRGSTPIGVFILSRIHTLDHNPAIARMIEEAGLSVGLTDFLHPPMEACDLILPLSHPMESWGDSEPRSGLKSRIRPAFSPLFDTLPEGDILLRLMDRGMSWEDYVGDHWSATGFGDLTQSFTEQGRRGSQPRLRVNEALGLLRTAGIAMGVEHRDPILLVDPSVRTFDGRSRIITLLHEIPDPLSAVSYGDWVSLPESSAAALRLGDGQAVEVTTAGGSATWAVRIQPGLTGDVAMTGLDRLNGLRLPIDPETGELIRSFGGIGFNRSRGRPLLAMLAGSMDASHREIFPGDAHHPPGYEAPEPGHEPERLYPVPEHTTYRWAMAIDLDRCTGCSACVAACYIENNIPITGPDEHQLGREMSWLRIQPYLDGDRPLEFFPMMCQQCTSAPCETVCPVYATYHNPEGLNAQIYNRCVGTRYCANNCPYKARRFNWFEHERAKPLDLLVNPDVSIRPKGVMEKCTFCVQRIREAKDHAKDEDRLVRDGEFTTACAQSCPTNAIVFGNLLDEESEVYRMAHSGRAWRVLESLGTGPAVYYLRRGEVSGHE